MSEQLTHISQISKIIESKTPKKFKPGIALITERQFELPRGIKILSEVSLKKIIAGNELQPPPAGNIKFARSGENDVIVYEGRLHYYDGVPMRTIGNIIYALKNSGIGKIISVDEVAMLNPRFRCGDIALIYDHINLMGDNPLIGKNENELGVRFPDMSNAYDKELFRKTYEVLQENLVAINESVYVGITGPQTETEAEARFFRDIGGDVAGYGMVPEDITAVHAGMDFVGIGLITRELIADKMAEDDRSEKQRTRDQNEFRAKSERKLAQLLPQIIKKISYIK